MPSLAHTITAWEDVLARLRRKSVSWRGNPLSERDLRTYTEAIVLCALHLIDMSTRHDGIGPQREIVAWATNVVTLDVSAVGSFLSDSVELLRHVAVPTDLNWFKRQLRHEYPFVGAFVSPIRGALSSFLERPNPRDFHVCNQFFSFLTHLTLNDTVIDLEPEYEGLECYLHSLHYPHSIIDEMNSVMIEWMKDFSLSEETFLPAHGPGAVAELPRTATQLQKYQVLGSDALLRYVFLKHAGIDVTSYLPLPEFSWKRQSKVVFVPKSMKTRRTISKEPATLMYFQQGIASRLMDYIHEHPFLRRHIDFSDQDKNAQLALKSSGDGKFATIDLSSASDTVTVELVKAVFRGTPLYPFLVALRSRTAELPSGKVLELEKFAPMGSALCFPIETLIFSCAVEVAVRRALRTHLGYFPRWSVYGDDIIVADDLFQDVLLLLGGLGFITNPSKSFASPYRFRESCGMEAYDGVDVTPMKISRRFVSLRDRITSHHASVYEGYTDMAYSAYRHNFPLLRAWIVRVLLNNQVGVPLFSGDPNFAVYSPCPDNFRAPWRFNYNLFRLEIRVVVARSKGKASPSDPSLETAALFETLRLSSQRTSDDMFHPRHRIQVSRGPVVTRLMRGWVEMPDKNQVSLPS